MPSKKRQAADKGSSVSEIDENTQRDLRLLEAALYVAGRPLEVNDLCQVLKTRSKNKAQSLVRKLLQEYERRNGALEILELKDDRYVLQLKSQFTTQVRRLVNRPLLSMGPLKTLSYVAFRQPVSQKRVTDVRGHHAYGHLKLLKGMGLIAGEKSGRSSVLKTTDYFADYFALSHDATSMKRELKRTLGSTAEEETSESRDG